MAPMTRYCANCGTEVDETAVFCPTCGQPIDQAMEAEMPAAPAWPEPEPAAARAEVQPPSSAAEPEVDPAPQAAWSAPPLADEATRVEPRPDVPPPPAPAAPVPPRARPEPRRGPGASLPITTPVTLSGWLIGIGSLLAALGVLIGLFDVVLNPIELILLVLLVAIAATVFFSARVPDIPNLRLVVLVVVLIGFGIALDRLGFGAAGAGELLLFLGTAAAAIGAILLELGKDQPLGGPGA
jgi:hypothetical protein